MRILKVIAVIIVIMTFSPVSSGCQTGFELWGHEGPQGPMEWPNRPK